jgi:Putative prokaryotic signal transducing protein
MEELLRTTDPTLVPFVQALLDAEDIDCFLFDVNMSILEGSLGILPRRVMVQRQDLFRARSILRSNGVEPFEGEGWA